MAHSVVGKQFVDQQRQEFVTFKSK